jgi:bacteriorhodopsin
MWLEVVATVVLYFFVWGEEGKHDQRPSMPTDESDALVLRSALWSIYLQLAFTSVTAASLLLPLDGKEEALIYIAILETVSQVIEFAYYMLAVYYYHGIRTWTRYIDWYVSTPVMLVSFMAFYVYRSSGRSLDVLFTDPELSLPTAAILSINAAMLMFGLIAELRGSAFEYRSACLASGMASFLAYQLIIFETHVLHSGDALQITLFAFVFIVWGSYGIAAALPYTLKNVLYNGLDIVSKNFYGLAIFVYALTKSF